jgi:hypothetical protein
MLHNLWIISQHPLWRYEFQVTSFTLRQQWCSVSPFQNPKSDVVRHLVWRNRPVSIADHKHM